MDFRKTLGLGIALLSMTALPLVSSADVIHLHEGKTVRCTIKRITGDIIEFNQGRFATQESIQRIRLTNRHDIVETRDNKKFFGEVVYIDKFKIELSTPTGRKRINRLLVRNLVLGTPAELPVSHNAKPAPSSAIQPAVSEPASDVDGMP